MTTQNDLLHSEASSLTARIITLTEQLNEGVATSGVTTPITILQQEREESTTPTTNSDQLWEVIRFVRREKEIAETKRDMAESQVTLLKQNVNHLEHQLEESRRQLQQLSDATEVRERERENILLF